MNLVDELVSQFVKATNNTAKPVQNSTVYGTVIYNDRAYVKLDGSDLLTPVTTTTTLKDGDRVAVKIENHSATVTGNVTSPSAQHKDVEGAIQAANKISEFEILVAYQITTGELAAAQATINNLRATVAEIESLGVEDFTAFKADIAKLEADFASLDYVYAEDVEALNATITNLRATLGNFASLNADHINAINADIDKLKGYTADFTYVSADVLKALKGRIDTLDVGNLEAAYGRIDDLEAGVANIETLMFGSATGNSIHTSFANSVIAQLGDAQIKSAMINNVAANKITSGDIITNNVRVKSEDGSLIISDETIQISDDNRVRVQIGKDASGDYSLNIWDASGNLMFSKGGITDSAIKEAIIRNDMISDTANISAHKLDIDSLFEEINGSNNTIKSTQIHLDDKGQSLDVAFKNLETGVTDLGETVSSQGTAISAMQGKFTSKVWQQDIDTAKDELSTQYSSLEQNLDSISTTVAKHTTQLTDFNNLEVGGRNLVAGTSRWTVHSGSVNGSSTGYKDVWSGKTIVPPTGTEYVVSFDAKGDIEQTITCYFYGPNTTLTSLSSTGQSKGNIGDGSCQVSITTEWKRYWVKWTQNPTDAIKNIIVGRNHGENNIYIRGVKLESGTIPTDWTPAPEDTDARITSAETRITQTANDLTILINDSAKKATNYINASGSGIVVGDMTANTLGKNVLIDSDSVDIRNGNTELATFGASQVELGKNSSDAVIKMCGNKGQIEYTTDDDSDETYLQMTANKLRLKSSEKSSLYSMYTNNSTRWEKSAVNVSPTEINMYASECIDPTMVEKVEGWDSSEFDVTPTEISGIADIVSLKGRTGMVLQTDAGAIKLRPITYIQTSRQVLISTSDKTRNDDGIAGWYIGPEGSAHATHATGGSSLNFHYAGSKNTTSTIAESASGEIKINGMRFGVNKILWSGVYYMNESQTVTLNESVSKQANGIVLVFSYYDSTNKVEKDHSFNTHFVSKKQIELFPGCGHTFFMGINAGFSSIGAKYLMFTDTTISGHVTNAGSGTNSGITFNNSNYVLRYVIGV